MPLNNILDAFFYLRHAPVSFPMHALKKKK